MLPMKRNSSGDLFYTTTCLLHQTIPELSNEELLLVIRPERLFAVANESNKDSDNTIIFKGLIT